jgi:hypothetical protein
MRKPTQETAQISNNDLARNEDLATEIIELTCQEVNSLTRAFEVISELCNQLQHDVLTESLADVAEHEIN